MTKQKQLKKKVEQLIRERECAGHIIWRDNHPNTYKQVYDYLINNPNFKIVEE